VVALAFDGGSFERKYIYTVTATYLTVKAPPFTPWHISRVLMRKWSNRERGLGHGTETLRSIRLLFFAPWRNRRPMAVAK